MLSGHWTQITSGLHGMEVRWSQMKSFSSQTVGLLWTVSSNVTQLRCFRSSDQSEVVVDFAVWLSCCQSDRTPAADHKTSLLYGGFAHHTKLCSYPLSIIAAVQMQVQSSGLETIVASVIYVLQPGKCLHPQRLSMDSTWSFEMEWRSLLRMFFTVF